MKTSINSSNPLYTRIVSIAPSVIFMAIIPIFITLHTFFSPLASSAKAAEPTFQLTVETYCKLFIALKEVTLSDWIMRTTLLKQYGKNSAFLGRVMSNHDYAYKKKRNNLYKAYNTTFPEYAKFNSQNHRKIIKYLKKHIAVKTRMDNLSKAIKEQMKAYDLVEASLAK